MLWVFWVSKRLQPPSQLVAVTWKEAGGRQIWLKKAVNCVRNFSPAADPWRAWTTYYLEVFHLRLWQAAFGRGWVTLPAGTPRVGNLRGQQPPFCLKTRKLSGYKLHRVPLTAEGLPAHAGSRMPGWPGYPTDPGSPRPRPAAPSGAAPHGTPPLPTAPGRRPRPYGGDRSSFSSSSCLPSCPCSEHPRPPPAGTEGAGAEGAALPCPALPPARRMVAAAASSPGSPLAAARRGLARPRCHVGSRGRRGRAGVGSLGAGAIGSGPGAERLRRGCTAARHPLSRPAPSPPPLFSPLLARPREGGSAMRLLWGPGGGGGGGRGGRGRGRHRSQDGEGSAGPAPAMSGAPQQQPPRRVTNVGSLLLTPQENESLFGFLGKKCVVSPYRGGEGTGASPAAPAGSGGSGPGAGGGVWGQPGRALGSWGCGSFILLLCPVPASGGGRPSQASLPARLARSAGRGAGNGGGGSGSSAGPGLRVRPRCFRTGVSAVLPPLAVHRRMELPLPCSRPLGCGGIRPPRSSRGARAPQVPLLDQAGTVTRCTSDATKHCWRSCRKACISARPAFGLVCTFLSLNNRFVYSNTSQILHSFLFLYQ